MIEKNSFLKSGSNNFVILNLSFVWHRNQQQPLEVQQSLETAPTPDSEEMDQQKGAESVTNDTDIQPELEPELPVDDQKKEPVEVNETESTAEGELNDSPQLSSTVCTSDENVDICQDSADPSQCVTVQEQIPVLKDSSDHLTEVKTA